MNLIFRVTRLLHLNKNITNTYTHTHAHTDICGRKILFNRNAELSIKCVPFKNSNKINLFGK